MSEPYRSPRDVEPPPRVRIRWLVMLVLATIAAAAALGSLKHVAAPLMRTVTYIAALAVLLTSLALLAPLVRRRR